MDNPQQIIETTETIITDIIGHYGWMFIAAFAVLLFKDVVANVLAGMTFMFGHDFDVDDIVYIGGEKKARIIRQNRKCPSNCKTFKLPTQSSHCERKPDINSFNSISLQVALKP